MPSSVPRLAHHPFPPLLRRARGPLKPTQLPLDCRRHISAYGYEQAKALVYSSHGEPKDVLKLHTHSIPPAHSNNLTLRFLASPLNPADINQIQGVYPSQPPLTTALGTPSPSAVAGNEGVAEVLSTGSSVTSVSKGDWVIMARTGLGTWRTHAQTPEDAVMRVANHEGLSATQVGSVSVNPCTAYRMLRDFEALAPRDWFVQNGANSGVGRMAVQIGRLWGLGSINVVRDRPGMEELRRELEGLGADVVVSEEEVQRGEFRDRVGEWTRGGREKVRLGLNCVGGKSATALARVLEPGGCLVTYGAMSRHPVQVPAGLLIFRNVRFEGFWVSKWAEGRPEEKRRTVEEVLGWMREGKVRDAPVEEVRWEWGTKEEELVGAAQRTLEGFRRGKGVFVFGET